jgi:hypothetical protein
LSLWNLLHRRLHPPPPLCNIDITTFDSTPRTVILWNWKTKQRLITQS